MDNRSSSCAVIGAGPIGLEAALYAATLGMDVTVYEAEERVGAHVAEWGHVPMFSPFGMNRSPLGADSLSRSGHEPPEDGYYQTGSGYVESYLRPLAQSLAGRIRLGTRVVSVGKEGLAKGDMIGSPQRLRRPFRLLLEESGRESVAHADVTLDCTGLYGNPNRLGNGGIPAIGERALSGRIEYGLPDVTGGDRGDYAAQTTLLVGDGYSAATTLRGLLRLAEQEPATEVVWLTGESAPRYEPIEDDPLPRRVALIEEANTIAREGRPGLELLSGGFVEEIEENGEGRIRVHVGGGRKLEVDRVVANVGFSPDGSIYRELQVHECYASGGPMALSAALLGADAGADCLAVPSFGPEILKNPEPGFYILGSKSYGKGFNFLLRNGFEQIRDAFALIFADPRLDLYARASVRY